ncbi:hypothetical protein HDV03_002456 [Kappamyces sp. JEL0829]|nr:hypothetical protein HDV03_002456 [Kappamyces sp. JEL0829]
MYSNGNSGNQANYPQYQSYREERQLDYHAPLRTNGGNNLSRPPSAVSERWTQRQGPGVGYAAPTYDRPPSSRMYTQPPDSYLQDEGSYPRHPNPSYNAASGYSARGAARASAPVQYLPDQGMHQDRRGEAFQPPPVDSRTRLRGRVPSVESFRSAVPSPYLGSQLGARNPQYPSSEYSEAPSRRVPPARTSYAPNYAAERDPYSARPLSAVYEAAPSASYDRGAAYERPGQYDRFDRGPAYQSNGPPQSQVGYEDMRNSSHNYGPPAQFEARQPYEQRPPSARNEYEPAPPQGPVYPSAQPKLYKSRSNLSMKVSPPSTAHSSAANASSSNFIRKSSLEEKQPLPESLKESSKKMQALLGQPHGAPAKGLYQDTPVEMLNMHGLQVNDTMSPSIPIANSSTLINGESPYAANIKQICVLARELAGLVLNRTTALSQDDWNLVCEKVELQAHLATQCESGAV